MYECVMGFREYQGNGAILAWAVIATLSHTCTCVKLYRDDMGLGKTIQCIALLWWALNVIQYM